MHPRLMRDTNILIIGGGLSGLSLADRLHQGAEDFLLTEANARFGGRIMTANTGTAQFDLGPAWFWPGQPRIAAMIARFGLNAFEQYHQGQLSFEDENGKVQRGQGMSSMRGSWRIEGGMTRLIDRLLEGLPAQRILAETRLTALAHSADGIVASFANGSHVRAKQVVLALPPRIAGATIRFDPALPQEAMAAMRDVPTWMAGHAKIITIYPEPFWRTAGLSGDAMSRIGPMVEIHDASPENGGPFALFGFVGIPPQARQDQDALETAAATQLVRLFGPRARDYDRMFIKDWAFDECVATSMDLAPLYAHPAYGTPPALNSLWDGNLICASSEMAPTFGGFLEGALEASELAYGRLR